VVSELWRSSTRFLFGDRVLLCELAGSCPLLEAINLVSGDVNAAGNVKRRQPILLPPSPRRTGRYSEGFDESIKQNDGACAVARYFIRLVVVSHSCCRISKFCRRCKPFLRFFCRLRLQLSPEDLAPRNGPPPFDGGCNLDHRVSRLRDILLADKRS
jgi:hypothetical protein